MITCPSTSPNGRPCDAQRDLCGVEAESEHPLPHYALRANPSRTQGRIEESWRDPADDPGRPKRCLACGYGWFGDWPCPNKRKAACFGEQVVKLFAELDREHEDLHKRWSAEATAGGAEYDPKAWRRDEREQLAHYKAQLAEHGYHGPLFPPNARSGW